LAFSPEFRDHLLDLMQPLGQVEAKRFFGGLGLFYHGAIFALASADVLYLKVDDESRPHFEAAGSAPFAYRRASGERVVNAYWRTPEEAMDDETEFLVWARRAVDAGLRADRAKAAKPRRRRKA
jgi:DNA transformation protein